MQTSNNVSTNRYPGGRSFNPEDRAIFFGRSADVKRFIDLLTIRQVIILLGKSGTGKSSLINAGIIPHLQQSGEYEHFVIRFNNFTEKDENNRRFPVDTVIKKLAENVYAKIDKDLALAIDDQDSFWYWIKQNQLAAAKRDRKKFILFFEQFEELFTYPVHEVERFSIQLAQLIYSPIPISFRKQIEQIEINGRVSKKIQDFLYEKPEVQLVFSLRSDRLSQMYSLTDLHPLILQNCYELDALTRDDARQAIIEPAKLYDQHFKSQPFTYEDSAIEKILDSVTDGEDQKIEAASLQIVCRYVEDTLISVGGKDEIKSKDLGDITNIFQNYYKTVLDKFSSVEQEKIRNLVEEQLISDNKRNTLTSDYIETQFKISSNALDILEQSSLLQKERFTRDRFMYEIGHDTIAAAVSKMATARREKQKRDDLEKELSREKQLNINKRRSLRNLRIVATIVGLLFLTALSFAFFWYKELKQNQEATKNAILEKNKFESRRKKEAITWSRYKLIIADDYLRRRTHGTDLRALDLYQQIVDTMRNYPHDTLYLKAQKDIRQLTSLNTLIP